MIPFEQSLRKLAEIESERWKAVLGFTGYEVSSWGRVRRKCDGYIFKQSSTPKGYKTVLFNNHGEPKRRLVHLLVMRSFVGECPRGCETNHIDSNPSNNCLWNLEYIPWRENRQSGERNGHARLTREDVVTIRELLKNEKYGDQRKIAKQYGVSFVAINHIKTGRTWQ